MKTKIIIGAVLFVCVGATVIAYYLKKKDEAKTDNVKRYTDDSFPAAEVMDTGLSEIKKASILLKKVLSKASLTDIRKPDK